MSCTAPLPAVDGDPAAARLALLGQAGQGAVPMVVEGVPQGVPAAALARAAGRAIEGASVAFSPEVRPTGAFLLLRAGAGPEGRGVDCRPRDKPVGDVPDGLLVAAWCEAGAALASVSVPLEGRDLGAFERAVWRAVRALFPDDYADRYGLDLLGLRIGLSGSVGF